MSLTNLSAKDLSKIVKLIEQKEDYQAKIAEIDKQLADFEGGKPVRAAARIEENGGPEETSAPARRAGRKRKAGKTKRGSLRDGIVQELRGAGKSGLHVKELSSRLGVKDPNIRVWFYSTGRKIPEIKQVAPATYAWKK